MDPRQLQALMQQMNAGGAGGFGGGPAPLCEFKAGRMNFDGRMVTPDRRRGWIRVLRDPHQPGMVTFEFCDEAKSPQETIILFPDIAKFEKVKQSDDRVYLLEIQPEPRRLFFWMQDDDKENDAERMKKCHNAINGIATEEPAAGGDAVPASTGTANAPRMQDSGFQTSGAAANNPQAAQQAAMMEHFFSQMQAEQNRVNSPGLASIITPDAMQKLLAEMSDEEKAALKEHLPTSQNTDEGLRTNLLSPQLRQAMRSLTEACQTSEENVLMILAMNDLEGVSNIPGADGVEAMLRGFIRRYEEDGADK